MYVMLFIYVQIYGIKKPVVENYYNKYKEGTMHKWKKTPPVNPRGIIRVLCRRFVSRKYYEHNFIIIAHW